MWNLKIFKISKTRKFNMYMAWYTLKKLHKKRKNFISLQKYIFIFENTNYKQVVFSFFIKPIENKELI